MPQYLIVGTKDRISKVDRVQAYARALEEAGQHVKLDIIPNGPHAFFGYTPKERAITRFEKYGVPFSAKVKAFFDAVFYPNRIE